MQRTTFCHETPVAEIRDGLVDIAIGGQPMVTCRISTARRFCELTLLKLNEWQAEQDGRGGVAPIKARRRH